MIAAACKFVLQLVLRAENPRMVDKVASKTWQKQRQLHGFIEHITVEIGIPYRRAYYYSSACLLQG